MVFDFPLWLQEDKAKNGPVTISFLKCTRIHEEVQTSPCNQWLFVCTVLISVVHICSYLCMSSMHVLVPFQCNSYSWYFHSPCGGENRNRVNDYVRPWCWHFPSDTFDPLFTFHIWMSHWLGSHVKGQVGLRCLRDCVIPYGQAGCQT